MHLKSTINNPGVSELGDPDWQNSAIPHICHDREWFGTYRTQDQTKLHYLIRIRRIVFIKLFFIMLNIISVMIEQ